MSEITEGSLLIVGGRRRGRPKSDVPHIRVSTWIPEAEFDRLVRIAQEKDVSLSTLIKERLARPVRSFPS